jgi:hypothetical protein
MQATVKTDDGNIITGEVVEEFNPHRFTVIDGFEDAVFEYRSTRSFRRRDAEGDGVWIDCTAVAFRSYHSECEITEAEAQRLIAGWRDPYPHVYKRDIDGALRKYESVDDIGRFWSRRLYKEVYSMDCEQYCIIHSSGWQRCDPSEWDNATSKPEPKPKFRPYRDAEECIKAMYAGRHPQLVMHEGTARAITLINGTGISVKHHGFVYWPNALKMFTWPDGTPFGVEE